ncbi:MAG: prolipoprotein diacylglyceryl transferase [Cyclobacteriaceae bacterium]|nr:prolipoprotein diacylglyceryl transferase [Cyclobacteriaceae bacterium]
MDKLQARWKVKSALQVIMILIVFACTGFTVLFLKRPLFAWLFNDAPMPLWASIIYYILILPVYNVFLLFYGFIFGQFQFFWDFEKRFFGRIFKRKKTTNP